MYEQSDIDFIASDDENDPRDCTSVWFKNRDFVCSCGILWFYGVDIPWITPNHPDRERMLKVAAL